MDRTAAAPITLAVVARLGAAVVFFTAKTLLTEDAFSFETGSSSLLSANRKMRRPISALASSASLTPISPRSASRSTSCN